MDVYTEIFRPCTGVGLSRLKAFLKRCGLDYDEAIDYTVLLTDDDGGIAATGSMDGCTLKCIAVAPEHQGEDLTARLMTELKREAFSRGLKTLMLFTKPLNEMMFRGFGFRPVIRAPHCLLMESGVKSLEDELNNIPPTDAKVIGAVVAHADPFTNGHLHLVRTAAAECDVVYVFILSENKGRFDPPARLEMAKLACAELPNVFVYPSGPYMVSSATFPTYFLRDKAKAGEVFCELDIRLFGERIAPKLNITRRYVGTEPFSEVTNAYNEALKAGLPGYGIEVREVLRCTAEGTIVSATAVRVLLKDGDREAVRSLVPPTTYAYLFH